MRLAFVQKLIDKLRGKSRRKPFLKDVFKKNREKKVLISYLAESFKKGVCVSELSYSHTNVFECHCIAEIFDELGFGVDVVSYACEDDIDFSKYELVFGFGEPFAKSLKCPDVKSFFYATGCYLGFSNPSTLKRVYDFYKAKGVMAFTSSRYFEKDSCPTLFFSDKIITLGNNFVKNTFKNALPQGFDLDIENLNCFFFDTYDIDISKKDFENAGKNFLWFGSTGALHKGLDVATDFFLKRPDLKLFICGAKEDEKEFCKYYRHVLDNKVENIVNLGFVDIQTDDFKKLMDNSAALILPSASEGGAASVLSVMANGGLVPIVPKSVGLDVEHYGFVFEDISEHSLCAMIDKFLKLTPQELQSLSLKIKKETRERYNFGRYRKRLGEIISAGCEKYLGGTNGQKC